MDLISQGLRFIYGKYLPSTVPSSRISNTRDTLNNCLGIERTTMEYQELPRMAGLRDDNDIIPYSTVCNWGCGHARGYGTFVVV
jgi:hypothetical protein